MILYVNFNAAYLILLKIKSRFAGFFYLSNKYILKSLQKLNINWGVYIEWKLLQNVILSVAKAKVRGIFQNCQMVISIRHILAELDYMQLSTPVKQIIQQQNLSWTIY